MLVNADFFQQVIIRPDDYKWTPSPAAGVERMMLDRIGKEVGHATSLVRYAADSDFPTHVHSGGEEILVLEGEFSDEHGNYPAGSYLRNPVGTSHTPKVGSSGATLLVKLHQFDERDTIQVNINTNVESWRPGLVSGLSVMPLHEFEVEHIALVKWAPFTRFQLHSHFGGEEIFVLNGTFMMSLAAIRPEHGYAARI